MNSINVCTFGKKHDIVLLLAEKAICSASREFAEKSGWPYAELVLQSPPRS